MSNQPTTRHLLNSVSDDISNLRRDVASLFSHTSRKTIPSGARELADYGKDRLHAGSEFAASQLRYLRANPTQSSAGILGGLILLGAVGAGIYYLCKSNCPKDCCGDEECDLENAGSDYQLPSDNS